MESKVRPPPKKSRREEFVDLALWYAEDDSHGYSQKPPSGRWGPDYDCSSLLSETAANQRYESAMQNNALMQAIREEGAATRAQADQRYMAEQDRRIAKLEMQNAMAGVIRYPMSTAYNAGFNPFCNCGNMCMAA